MNLYDTVIGQYPRVFLTQFMETPFNIPYDTQLRKFSRELAQHFDLIDYTTLTQLKDHFDWDLVLKHIPNDQMTRLLSLPNIPWTSVLGRDYIPLKALKKADTDFSRMRKVSKSIQSVDVLREYRHWMNWEFVSIYYPPDHPVFRDPDFSKALRWRLISKRGDLTENMVEPMLTVEPPVNWTIVTENFLSKNQDLIPKYLDRVRWNHLKNVTVETTQKFARHLKGYRVFHNRDDRLSAEDAEAILRVKDLKRYRKKISVKNIALDREFIERHRDELDFGTLNESDQRNKLLISLIEYIPWMSLYGDWRFAFGKGRCVKTKLYNRRPDNKWERDKNKLFPYIVFHLRNATGHPIDWEAMQKRIDESSANVTVNQIKFDLFIKTVGGSRAEFIQSVIDNFIE